MLMLHGTHAVAGVSSEDGLSVTGAYALVLVHAILVPMLLQMFFYSVLLALLLLALLCWRP
jgi:hypothetical protein